MQRISRADFLYRLRSHGPEKTLLIWDEDLGNRSVTNDIENVVADIAAYESMDLTGYLIFYRDSIGEWSGWNDHSKEFYPLRPAMIHHIDFRSHPVKRLEK
jgi:hypothetical protein